jgi:hypothetical protein
MGIKKTHNKKKIYSAKHQKKTVSHYLRIYFYSLMMGSAVFLVGSLFQPLQSSIAKTQSVPQCANEKSCKTDLSVAIDNKTLGFFQGRTVAPPLIDLAHESTVSTVLGASDPNIEKHIYIDLSMQQLYAYENNKQIFKTFIASGKWNPTPVGNFHIWEKLRATRMAGGEGADAYDLPNVPYVMYFYQDYGLHGAYWHNNFGHMMSHGCVNMRIVDAKTVYEWSDVGTPVSVCNTFAEPNTCVQKNSVQ